jgi:CRISPR/Cas system-associated protein Csm6
MYIQDKSKGAIPPATDSRSRISGGLLAKNVENTFKRGSPKSKRTRHTLQRENAAELERDTVGKHAKLEKEFLDELLNIPEADIPTELRQKDENRFSAEFSSLYLMDIHPQTDKIVLLATDSGAGVFAARVNKRLICHRLMGASREAVTTWKNDIEPSQYAPLNQVQIVRVEKMRMDNAGDFERYGVPNLLKVIEDIDKNHPDDEKRVNFTGGFKGIIPVLTAIAWRYDWQIFYLYEDSSDRVMLKRPDWICVSQQHTTEPVVKVEVTR